MFGGEGFDDMRGNEDTASGVDTGDGEGGGGDCDTTVEQQINC